MVQHAELQAEAAPSIDHAAVFEQAAAPCLLLRPDAPRFSVLAANAGFFAATGAAPELASGRALKEVLAASGVSLAEPVLSSLLAAIERAVASRAPARLRLAAPEGASGQSRARPVFDEAALTPVPHAGGEVALVALWLERQRGGLQEQDDARAVATELAERTRELASARAELQALTYSVSHDLRAPLRAIDGFAQALAEDFGPLVDDRALHCVERVRSGARRMSSLLDDLLELSRVQLAPLERARVNVSEVARKLAAELGASAPERAPNVSVEAGLELNADPQLIQVLLAKLLDNAWKFTSKQPTAAVRVARHAGDGPPTLMVSDNGVGFEMAYATRLFAPFQRLHRATDYSGNGIGLAIAQRIVSRHGGQIWASAEPGRGACFYFCLEGGARG